MDADFVHCMFSISGSEPLGYLEKTLQKLEYLLSPCLLLYALILIKDAENPK